MCLGRQPRGRRTSARWILTTYKISTIETAVRERQELREVADNLETEANELEGLVTWFSIHRKDASTNTQLQTLRDQVAAKTRERQSGRF